MSERVQLLLSDRILGMTLVPEGRIWNYGIGLTQMWSPSLGYSMILDTPLMFWAEEHRPAAFLSVRSVLSLFWLSFAADWILSTSLRTYKPETIVLM
jgi:hypothetical protein